MITHEELSQKLYEAWCSELVDGSSAQFEDWDKLGIKYKAAWSAVAFTAWEHVEGENAVWAEESSRRSENFVELLVEFMNRAEDVIG
jgi:hypothetical protein